MKWKSRLINRSLGLLQISVRALLDLLHRQIGRESEVQLLPKFLGAETEIAVRAFKQIALQPFFVIFERFGGLFLDWGEIFFQLRRLVEQRVETVAHQIDCALDLFDRRFRVNSGRMLEIRFRLLDHDWNAIHPLA